MERPKRLIEISFEVCNKVGGIYTVVSSKAHVTKQNYDDYILVGPYFENQANVEFVKTTPPPEYKSIIEEFCRNGVCVHYGKWHIFGEPNVILIEYKGAFSKVNEFKKIFWEKFGLDSLNAGYDYDEPMAFSLVAGMLIEQIVNKTPQVSTVCHCHEWMTGFANLYLKSQEVKCGTVFTTHATMLGRSICGTGEDLYSVLDTVNPEEEARKHNIFAKFSAERTCAAVSDVFTTVSEITSQEATKLLGKKPDHVVINGLDKRMFPTFEDAAILHAQARDRLREFCMYHFFPYQKFNLQNTLFMYTSGRHEVHNKGIDTTVASLARLNQQLKQDPTSKNVVVFFWVPHNTYGVRQDVLDSKTYFQHVKNHLINNNEELLKSIINNVMMEKELACERLFSDDFYYTLTKVRKQFHKEGNAPLSPFNIDEDHEIIKLFYLYGLLNHESDKVKVVLYPVYLNGFDSLLDLTYNQAIAGCHLGLFPSYYEPWGYTPAESVAMGIPAVTSDLAGFGRYVEDNPTKGVYVLKRLQRSTDDTVEAYTEILKTYIDCHKKDRIDQKIAAKQFSYDLDWTNIIANYLRVHDEAWNKVNKNK